MKKILLVMLATLCIDILNAQDIIYTTDGQTIEAKQIKREGTSFRFRLFSASVMDTKTYLIDLERVTKIKYEDGRVYENKPIIEVAHTQSPLSTTSTTDKPKSKSGSRDTIVAYTTLSNVKQVTPGLFNAYPKYKNPALAFTSSLLVPGLGQMYNDEVIKGLVFFGTDVGLLGIMAYEFNQDGQIPILATILSLGVSLAAAIEAAITSDNLNNSHGYVSLYPSINNMPLMAFNEGNTVIPSMALQFSF